MPCRWAGVATRTGAGTRPDLRTPALLERPGWLARYQRGLVVLDVALVVVAIAAALVLRSSVGSGELDGLTYGAAALLLGVSWCAALALTRSYEARYLEEGPEELKRVAQAGVRVAATVGIVCFVGKLGLSRGFVSLVLPLGTTLLLAGRVGARAVLRCRRRQGHWQHRVLVVGGAQQVRELAGQLALDSGFTVVGAWNPAGSVSDVGVPAFDGEQDVQWLAATTGADTVAVTAWEGMSPAFLQGVALALETTRVDLVVAPALLGATGSRVAVDPAAGLPLLRLHDVELAGVDRVVKGVLDRVTAAALLLLLSPVLAAAALALRLTGSPVLTSQERIGRDAGAFGLLRFAVHDPKAADRRGSRSRVGVVLERLHLAALPSLVNVLRGELSFVGPRAMPAHQRRATDVEEARLLRVKPGLTGLAQVRGRHPSSTEALHLDQQYVDNWSLGLDALVLLRTALRWLP